MSDALPSTPPPLCPGEVIRFRSRWGPKVSAVYVPHPSGHGGACWTLFVYEANEKLPATAYLYRTPADRCPISYAHMNLLPGSVVQTERDAAAVARFHLEAEGLR